MLIEIGGKYIDDDSVVAVTADRYDNVYVNLTTGKDIKVEGVPIDDVVAAINPRRPAGGNVRELRP